MSGSCPSICSKIQFASFIWSGNNCVGNKLQLSRSLLRVYLNVYFFFVVFLTLYGFCGANAAPSKISIRPQFTQVSSAEPLFISLIRMRSKRDIKMGRLCTPGGAVLGFVGGGCDVPFFKW